MSYQRSTGIHVRKLLQHANAKKGFLNVNLVSSSILSRAPCNTPPPPPPSEREKNNEWNVGCSWCGPWSYLDTLLMELRRLQLKHPNSQSSSTPVGHWNSRKERLTGCKNKLHHFCHIVLQVRYFTKILFEGVGLRRLFSRRCFFFLTRILKSKLNTICENSILFFLIDFVHFRYL